MSADNDFQPAGETEIDEFGRPVPPPVTAPWPAVLAGCLICAAISVRTVVVYWNARPPLPTYFASGVIGVLPFVYSKIAEGRGWKINSGRGLRAIIGLATTIAFFAGFMMLLNSVGTVKHCDSGCFDGG